MAKKEYPAGPRKRLPTHPGAVLKGILAAMEVSVLAAARAIGVSQPSLAAVLHGQSALTPEMAARLGAYIGNDDAPELWLAMQADHDLAQARAKLKPELARIKKAAA